MKSDSFHSISCNKLWSYSEILDDRVSYIDILEDTVSFLTITRIELPPFRNCSNKPVAVFLAVFSDVGKINCKVIGF